MPEHGARAEASLDILMVETRILGRHKEGTRPTAARGPSPKPDNCSNDQLANIESNQTRASI
ncbi:uncharacterized protein K441DRAFT_656984 [Cenococcum geophilum 1.58]|uniref:uncharacterized protein n=1 Tax=Cenococcum geophilum 1.58 TaxID=794803 RepID=UPI00358E3A95|nr:hypothetical protein K441DRAFT_656984 [Cenococcum geophilum 1.58]